MSETKTDIVDRLRAFKTGCDKSECERMIFTPLVCEQAADEIARLREALAFYFAMDEEKPTSWKYRREKAEELARSVINSSGTLTSPAVKDCLTTECPTRREIINERDQTFALMLARAEKAEAQVAALREALQKLITHTLDCEKQLDEFHGLGDDAGSGMSSVVCDARAALATGGNDAV